MNNHVAKCEFYRYTGTMEQKPAIRHAEFVTSVGLGQDYPQNLPMEIAIVGKSNVGKSSLINAVTNNGKLARVSSQPGKTRLINYYSINRGQFYIVDLPGYGYAKASKSEQKNWGKLIEQYLSSGRVRHLFLLLDIRHEPTENDRQMFQYLLFYNIPFTLIATKADKIPKSRRRQQANSNAKLLGAPPYAIPFSSESGEGKEELIGRISQLVSDMQPSKAE